MHPSPNIQKRSRSFRELLKSSTWQEWSLRFLEAANRVTSVAVMTHEHTLAHMRFTPKESPYSFVAMVPQDVTEKLLVEELRR